MNEIGTRAVRCDGQFIGQFRKVHKADWETVSKNGCPILFPSETEAKLAGWESLAASGHLTSLLRRDGCTVAESARAAAEKLFTRETADGKAEAQA
jgi:hypothetical protein